MQQPGRHLHSWVSYPRPNENVEQMEIRCDSELRVLSRQRKKEQREESLCPVVVLCIQSVSHGLFVWFHVSHTLPVLVDLTFPSNSRIMILSPKVDYPFLPRLSIEPDLVTRRHVALLFNGGNTVREAATTRTS